MRGRVRGSFIVGFGVDLVGRVFLGLDGLEIYMARRFDGRVWVWDCLMEMK